MVINIFCTTIHLCHWCKLEQLMRIEKTSISHNTFWNITVFFFVEFFCRSFLQSSIINSLSHNITNFILFKLEQRQFDIQHKGAVANATNVLHAYFCMWHAKNNHTFLLKIKCSQYYKFCIIIISSPTTSLLLHYSI